MDQIDRSIFDMINADQTCVGCEACASVCPKGAIKMEADDHGFLIPQINESLCVRCGLCDKVCPVLSPDRFFENQQYEPQVFGGYSLDQKTRFASTSGGVFSEIAAAFIDQDGYVCGAIYDENNDVCHYITNKSDDIGRLRQSKYAQSRKGSIYSQIKKLLQAGETVLFVGCPCEVTALNNYIGHTEEKLFTIDFVCLGANSPLAFNAYKADLEKRYHSDIACIWFKNKKYSWNRFSTLVTFKNGKKYQKDRYSDPYMRCYIERQLLIRPSCQKCLFKGLPHGTDLTLADFWGVEKVIPGIDSKHGVSLVSANSEKGMRLISSAETHLYIRKVDEKSYAKNPMLQQCPVLENDTDSFYDDMKKDGFMMAAHRHLPYDAAYYLRRTYRAIRIRLLGR